MTAGDRRPDLDMVAGLSAEPRTPRVVDDGLLPVRRVIAERQDVGVLNVVAVLIFCTGSVVLLGLAMASGDYDLWGGFMVGPFLVALIVPMAAKAARATGDPLVGKIVLYGGALKVIAGTTLQYWVTYGLYDRSDAQRYHLAGSTLANSLRSGVLEGNEEVSGTRFAEVLTGVVYAALGSSRVIGFVVFSFAAMVGLYLFLRAFAIALPDHRVDVYAAALFLTPSLLTWPSTIGKEAWMLLTLGMAIFGTVTLFSLRRWTGLIWAGLGLWGAAVMRPHVALLFVLAVAISAGVQAVVSRPDLSARFQSWRRMTNVVVLVLAVVGAVALVAISESFFGLDSLNPDSASDVIDEVEEDSSLGGSAFSPTDPSTPHGYVIAVATVIARPFPHEASSIEMVLSGFEGLTILGLLVWALVRRRPELVRAMRSSNLLPLSVAFSIGFVYIFAALANFGLLARQRVQLLPFLFVIIAVALQSRAVGETEESSAGDQTQRPVQNTGA